MNANEYWQALCRKQPRLRDPEATVRITSGNLKKIVLQAAKCCDGKPEDFGQILSDMMYGKGKQ